MSRSLNGTDPIQTTLFASTGTSWHEAEWSVIISSDNGLSPGRCQAIIWNNAGMLLNGPLGTNLSEILNKIYIFSFNKMHLKRSSAQKAAILSRPQCVNETTIQGLLWCVKTPHLDPGKKNSFLFMNVRKHNCSSEFLGYTIRKYKQTHSYKLNNSLTNILILWTMVRSNIHVSSNLMCKQGQQWVSANWVKICCVIPRGQVCSSVWYQWVLLNHCVKTMVQVYVIVRYQWFSLTPLYDTNGLILTPLYDTNGLV